ncbi:MAG TPA: GNAT family N-acetyltransferase [Kribbella sp.]|uniref:GNAT family N-acetyltransferase n=1 Tax=Kribbella sp. TaxID=1871183 RepID=UPI002D782BE9|nr:GNAT family N-acetyltransferase [Kribbella sp.]HET6296171.1 GNAT family N-acetyltransferase [Kribbella sp.]
MASFLIIRPGDRADVPAVLGLLDGATEWLVSIGRTDQWGTEPHSTDPRRIKRVTGYADAGSLWIAESAGRVVGALVVGEPMPYVPPATEPELYVQLLVTDRASRGQGIGAELLDHARSLARNEGIELVRVDCFAGGEGALVRYYEQQGFTRAEAFAVPVSDSSEWPGQVLFQRL